MVTNYVFAFRVVLSQDAVPGQVTSLSSSANVNGEILYIQSYDQISHGSGAVQVVGGGIRSSNYALTARSGNGQGINRTWEVYGTASTAT